MKGPLSKIRRRKPDADATPATPEAAITHAPASGEPVADQATVVLAPTEQPPGVPAGVETVADSAPSFRDRGRYRRRLRYLRRVRELGFRDLGGLVFDLHRFDQEGQELVRSKLHALQQVDGELRALERALDDRRDILELREPGIAACQRCGALHGSDARYCPSCGVPFTGPRAFAEIGEGGVQTVGEIGAVSPAVEATTPIEHDAERAAAEAPQAPAEAGSEPDAPGGEEPVAASEEPVAEPDEPAAETDGAPPEATADQPTTEQPAVALPEDEAPATAAHDWLPSGLPPSTDADPDTESGAGDDDQNGTSDQATRELDAAEVEDSSDRDS